MLMQQMCFAVKANYLIPDRNAHHYLCRMLITCGCCSIALLDLWNHYRRIIKLVLHTQHTWSMHIKDYQQLIHTWRDQQKEWKGNNTKNVFFFLINSFLNNFISSDISYWLTERKYGHCFIRSFLKNVSRVDYITWLRKLCEIASKTQLLCNYIILQQLFVAWFPHSQ